MDNLQWNRVQVATILPTPNRTQKHRHSLSDTLSLRGLRSNPCALAPRSSRRTPWRFEEVVALSACPPRSPAKTAAQLTAGS